MSTNVGLVAPLDTPSPRTSPCTNTVLPAPSSPVRATTSPARSVAANACPAASVCSANSARSLVSIGEPAKRLAERLHHVARDERLLAHPLGRDVAGESVQ